MFILFILCAFTVISAYYTNNLFKSSSLSNSANLAESQQVIQLWTNGQSFPISFLESIVTFILPDMVIILVADIVTGEYQDGSIKLCLTRDISRTQLLFAKALALFFIIGSLLIFAMLASYIMGIIALGWGNEFIIKNITMPSGFSVLFTLLIYVFSTIPLFSFGMIIMFFSIISLNEGALVSIGIGILVTLMIANEVFSSISPFIINSYFNIFNMISSEGINASIIMGLFMTLLYAVIFYSLSLIIFKRKDILV